MTSKNASKKDIVKKYEILKAILFATFFPGIYLIGKLITEVL